MSCAFGAPETDPIEIIVALGSRLNPKHISLPLHARLNSIAANAFVSKLQYSTNPEATHLAGWSSGAVPGVLMALIRVVWELLTLAQYSDEPVDRKRRWKGVQSKGDALRSAILKRGMPSPYTGKPGAAPLERADSGSAIHIPW
jgi:hypothetical protein